MLGKLHATEWIVLMLIGISMVTGFILVFNDRPGFLAFTKEDGLVEWLTVLGLLLGAVVAWRRVIKLQHKKGVVFLVTSFLLGLVLIFGAGEEISWGQRILGLKSPEYFQEHNAQGETNLHNLVLGGVRLNRWIFSIGLTVILGSYILLMPYLYRSKSWMRRFVNYFGIPLPRAYQIIAFILVWGLTELMPDGKRAEIAEQGTTLLLFLIIAFPWNKETFLKEPSTDLKSH
jgi:hypothetical protein